MFLWIMPVRCHKKDYLQEKENGSLQDPGLQGHSVKIHTAVTISYRVPSDRVPCDDGADRGASSEHEDVPFPSRRNRHLAILLHISGFCT